MARHPASVSSVLALASACPTLAAVAPSDNEIGYRYSHYQEADAPANRVASGSTERYQIDIHQLHWRQVIAEQWQLQAAASLESMSGASALQTYRNDAGQSEVIMSGASIEERRTDGRISISRFFDEGTLSAGYYQSQENDYAARAVNVSGELELNQAHTVLSAGYSLSNDTLNPSDANGIAQREAADGETKQTRDMYVGVSQILNRYEVIQLTLAQRYSDGYLSDPYRSIDVRPQERLGSSISLLYRFYMAPWNGAWHWDYRYYKDDWEVASHTLEGRWLQQLTDHVRWRIALRGYQQSEAEFYSLAATRETSFQSSDARLSAYGALTASLGLDLGLDDVTVSIDWSQYESREQWGPARNDADEAPSLVNYQLLSLGLLYRY
ncbi:hypothetical protein CHH28_09300 [Bacterioplanes sanyensis]|uniref:DUF3570 domain-containing protein n=1 Tax=Bacterioplanes sanyensis TaxID=1249553 RepID=A0A222FIK6_9GAMM|nr:DUF3570 domain-containing protein [Bacterioplanes sanyensis]ASP38865.1 hypothetical protein CHH28_09300 [Bacterioplanes sanyensis]